MREIKKYTLNGCAQTIYCQLTTSSLDGYDSIRYTTYGVCFTNESGEVVMECKDISTDCRLVEEYIDLCIAHEVSGVHLRDVLEDYLV